MSGSVSPPFAPTASLKAAMVAFEGHMEREGFSENTIKAFVSDLNILREFLGAGRSVGQIGTRDLNEFLDWLQHGRDVPCNAKSLARRLTTLKVFFGWLTESGVLEADPAAPVAHQPVSTPLPQVLQDDQVDRVLEVTQALRQRSTGPATSLRAEPLGLRGSAEAHPKPLGTKPQAEGSVEPARERLGSGGKADARPHLLVTLLLHTGIKKSECMSIVLNHLDLSDADAPAVWIRYQDPRRRHKERKLSLPQAWPAVLEEYKGQHDIEDTLFPCTARNLEYVLEDVAQMAELPEGLSFEMLRWTSAVRDYRAQMPAERQRQKMGLSKASWREVKVKLARLAHKAP